MPNRSEARRTICGHRVIGISFSRVFAISPPVALLALGLGSLSTPSAWGAPQDVGYEINQEQHGREKLKEKFIREHSGPSGQIRPDLWRKGMKHAARMSIAPHIGAAGPASHLAPPIHPIPAGP